MVQKRVHHALHDLAYGRRRRVPAWVVYWNWEPSSLLDYAPDVKKQKNISSYLLLIKASIVMSIS